MPRIRVPLALACAALWVVASPEAARAALSRQEVTPPAPGEPADSLAALVAEALARNPALTAAAHAADAARERISQAGAWDDPVLTFGFINLPTSFDFDEDFMTMKVVQVGQRIPIPGKLGARRAAAGRHAASREHLIAAERIAIATDVKRAFAEVYYLDRALGITARTRAVLDGVRELSLVGYATGRARQPDVLRAGIEIDELERERVALAEARRAAAARLNALLDRPPDARVGPAAYPPAMRRAALASGGRRWGAALGRAAPLPPLDSLIDRAVRSRPALLAHVERIAADEAMVRFARRDVWPDPELALGYGQRDGRRDMLSATLSFRLPVFAGGKQNAAVREAEASLARSHAEHTAMVNGIEREVTEAYAHLVEAWGRLAIVDEDALRRAAANVEATLAAYRAGNADFLTLLDAETRRFDFELKRERGLADFLSAWAGLERAVGEEIEP